MSTVFILLMLICTHGTMVSAECFDISPRNDIFLKKGEDLHFSCSLKTGDTACINRYSINNIRIQKGSEKVQPEHIVFREAEKAAIATIRNVTFSDDGYYMCVYGKNTHALLQVHVGEPPDAPESLKCLSRNFNDLTCSFLLSNKTVNIPINWTMEFRRYHQDWIPIPESNCNRDNYTCWLDSRLENLSIYTFMPSANYYVRVVVWNRLGNATTDTTIDHSESIVKPSPVEMLGYNLSASRRHCHLQWSLSVDLPRILLDYKIVVSSVWDTRMHLIQNRTAASEGYVLADLIPFAEYSVSVQTRPSAAELDIYWSDPRTVEFVTPSAISEHTVTVAAGSFMMLDCGREVMCLVLYWRNPEKRYWYGNITGYNVTVREFEACSGQTCNLPPEIVTGMTVYRTLKTELLKDSNYQVRIMLINSKGVSRNHSEISIPNWSTGQAFKLEWVVVEMTQDSVLISWYIYEQYCSDVTSVTYYWCLEDLGSPFDSSHVACNEGFNWTKFNLTDGCGTQTGHNISKPLDRPNLKYAVSVEANTVSGGLSWEKFRFIKHRVPEKPVYSVSVDGTSVKVHIHYRDYHYSDGGKPVKYSVVYSECIYKSDCISDLSDGTSKTFSVDFTKQVYIVDNLQPGSQYKFQVASSNSFGKNEYGDSVMVTIATDIKAKVARLVSGILLSVSVVTFTVLLCCYCRRKLRRTVRIRLPNEIDETDEPDETKLMMEGKKTHKAVPTDHDSSKGSDSPVSRKFSNPLQRNGLTINPDSLESRPSSNAEPMSPPTQIGILNVWECAQVDSTSHSDTDEDMSHGQAERVECERKEKFFSNISGNHCLVSVSCDHLITTGNFADSLDTTNSEVSTNDSLKRDTTDYHLINFCETLPNLSETTKKININLEYVEITV